MKTCLKDLLLNVYAVQKGASKNAVDTDKDIVTACDLAISETIREEVLNWKFPLQIVTEEYDKANKNCETPEYYVFVDELDGTDNAFRAIDVLPSVTLIQIARAAQCEVKFKDFVLVGAVEHSSGTVYITEKDAGIQKYEIKNLEIAYKLEEVQIQPRHTKQSVVITDVYSMMQETEILMEIAKRYQTKDFGASAATYLWVAEGLFEAYASSHKKGHELPLLYLMCREAGVKMTDFNGKVYDEVAYDFNSTRYQVIAGIESVHEVLVSALKAYAKEM